MKYVLIFIVLLGVLVYISGRDKRRIRKEERQRKEQESLEIKNRLLQPDKQDEVLAVIDVTKGNIHNAKVIYEKYGLTLSDAREVLETLTERGLIEKPKLSLEEVETVIDRSKGDIHNIKLIREHYGMDLKSAKELWDSIRNEETKEH